MALFDPFLDTGDKIASIVGAICALSALWVAVRTGSQRRGRRDPRLTTLREAQRADSARHRYRFFGDHVPTLTELYVRPRASPSGVPGDREKARTVQASQILAVYKHAVLLGDAGAGKSTFLAAVAGELALRGDGDLAVIVPAADLAGRPLPTALSEVVRRDLGVDLPAEVFERPPRRGSHWRILIDGLDEVVSARDRSDVLWRIRDLLNAAGPYRMVITSRPLTEPELAGLNVPDVGVYDLRPFDRRELDEFARRWFAARIPNDRRSADDVAGRFLARVDGARLGPVARVPLLATIAAIVYGTTDDRELPSSRAALYRRFTDHLLDGRQSLERFQEAIEPELLSRGLPGEAVADWFRSDVHRHVSDLLSACGVAWLADPNVRLTDVAAAWIRTNGPHDLTRLAPDGDRLLRELLLTTGICTLRKNRVVFVHQSFAEFFAAEHDVAGAAFDEQTWMLEAINPVTRGRAAFRLARRPDADYLINALLERDEPIVAGDLLADGILVSPRTHDHIVRRMLMDVERETERAPDALRILGELSLDAGVLQRMCRLAADPAVSAWARALVADRVADVDPAAGHELLRTVAGNSDEVVHAWVADALRDRAGLSVPMLTIDLSAPQRPLGTLARLALNQRLSDTRTSELDRKAAAVQLAEHGDLAALRAMAEATDIHPDQRVSLATALADTGDPELLRKLGTKEAGSAQASYAAALALFDRRDPMAAAALRRVVDVHPLYPMAHAAAARCADLGDPAPLTQLARQPGQGHVRLAAARRLAALGHPEALTWLLDGHLGPDLEAYALAGLLQAGRAEAVPRLGALVRRHRFTFDRRMEYRYLMAANGDEESREWLHRRMTRSNSSIESIEAAVTLGLLADARGTAVLHQIADDTGYHRIDRIRAARGLISVEPQTGVRVLHRLASPASPARLRLLAASEALKLLNTTTLLDRIIMDPMAATDIRVEASRILIDFRMDLFVGTAEMLPPELLTRLADLARAEDTPDALRITTAHVLAIDDARAVLEPIASGEGEPNTRLDAILHLDSIDRQAAGAAFATLLRDDRIPRFQRWVMLLENSELLPEGDADILRRRFGDPDQQSVRFICGTLLLFLWKPTQIFEFQR
ncbi:NACHT domain-containing NTPase [Actinoplanes sp. OR16]|uniref:NACHT domain-containing protein n=1 Tax=Actinoplanes sp. OR16 TaxID=946334 RepID=UPI00135F1ADA|nr:NACHT domain-containing protein [Actinoplanes sp. OR16]